MNLSRRRLLLAGLGLTQATLLSRFGYREARANGAATSANKLLVIHIEGGVHFESLFGAMSAAGINKHIPLPFGSFGARSPVGYTPSMVRTLDNQAADLSNSTAGPRPIAMPVYWNWASPGDHDSGTDPNTNANYFRYGYSLADPTFEVFKRMAVIVGVDQGTAAHASGKIASFCGVAGENFRAPAISAVAAHYLSTAFPERVLPNLQLGSIQAPAVSLPSQFSTIPMGSPLAASLSFTQKHDRAWAGLRTRTSTPRVAFDGTPLDGSLNLTRIEALQMEEARALRTSAGNEADRLLEGLHDSLAQSSIVLANNVVDVISATPGFEHLTSQGPLYSQKVACLEGSSSCWGWTDGSMGQIDTALKVLKSGLASSVTYRAVGPDSINGFDTHNGGAPDGGVGFAYSSTRARALLEEIGRLLIEMQLTPGAATGCSLLDETLVYICSDFGRSFPLAGDDHHPATVAILVGGGVQGNTMVGGWNESVPVGSSPMGLATAVTEEDGSAATRLLRAQDVAATVLYGLGLDPKKDFFLPGGYGVVKGVFG